MPSNVATPTFRPTYTRMPDGRQVEVRRAIPVAEDAPAPKKGFLARLFGPREPRAQAPGQAAGAAATPRGRTMGPGAPKPINQLAHPGVQLGNGKSTIAEAGCFLSSCTMASNLLHPGQSLGAVEANRRVKAQGGFAGSGLELSRAAPALGMQQVSRRPLGGVNDGTVLARLDQHLAAGKPAVAGVDFRAGRSSGHSDADHFITIYGKRGNDYLAMDPAGGQPVTISRGTDGRLTYRGASDYKLSEVLLLDRR